MSSILIFKTSALRLDVTAAAICCRQLHMQQLVQLSVLFSAQLNPIMLFCIFHEAGCWMPAVQSLLICNYQGEGSFSSGWDAVSDSPPSFASDGQNDNNNRRSVFPVRHKLPNFASAVRGTTVRHQFKRSEPVIGGASLNLHLFSIRRLQQATSYICLL